MECDQETRREWLKATGKINLMRIIRTIYKISPFLLAVGTTIAGANPVQSGSDSAIVPKKPVPETISGTQASKTAIEGEMKSLSLMGLDGVKHTLAEWQGKVIMINFWATWCSPCLYEIRDFVAYQEQYKDHGLQIVGIGLDEEAKLRNVQRTLEINYPVLIAEPADNGGLMERWGNSSGVVPYTVVIDRDGRIKYAQHGLVGREEFEENVLPLLDK
jgi:peroxiredoxin